MDCMANLSYDDRVKMLGDQVNSLASVVDATHDTIRGCVMSLMESDSVEEFYEEKAIEMYRAINDIVIHSMRVSIVIRSVFNHLEDVVSSIDKFESSVKTLIGECKHRKDRAAVMCFYKSCAALLEGFFEDMQGLKFFPDGKHA